MTKKIISNSECFGIAWDGTVPECSQCDASSQCEKITKQQTKLLKPESPNPYTPSKLEKVELEVSTSASKKAPKPATKPKAEKQPKQPDNPNWPDFKSLTMDELIQLCKDKNIDITKWDSYELRIKRMQITMQLKKAEW